MRKINKNVELIKLAINIQSSLKKEIFCVEMQVNKYTYHGICLLGFLKIFAAISGSISLIYFAKLLPVSITSGKFRISSALGLVAGFLSKSFSIRLLIRGEILEGTLIGLGSVISIN